MTPSSAVEKLRAALTGPLLFPGDAAYDEARKIHNGMIDRRPSIIVRCANTNDVSLAVEFARQNHEPISVRGAGHNVAGTCISGDAMLIDLSAMKGSRNNSGQGSRYAAGRH